MKNVLVLLMQANYIKQHLFNSVSTREMTTTDLKTTYYVNQLSSY